MDVRVLVVGFGHVGRAFARLTALKGSLVERRFGVRVKIVGVVDSRGAALKPEGFSGAELLKVSEVPRSSVCFSEPYGVCGLSLKSLYDSVQPDVHVEVTPSNYVSGEPGLSNVMFALSRGANVVLANKAPLALKFDDIMGSARARGLKVKFRATVMGGSPLIDTVLSLRSHEVKKVYGIFNATTNYILTLMHESLIGLDEALKTAQAMGVAEADPSLDIDGWDAAAKLVILARLLGLKLNISGIARESLSKVTLRDVVEALKRNSVIKHVAGFDALSGEAWVKPETLSSDSVLSKVNGLLNAAVIETDVCDYILIGKGGGPVETAHSLLDDIVSITGGLI